MTENLKCISCSTEITNMEGFTRFKCPSCGNVELVRCRHCRKIGAKYKCGSCGFEGPN